MAARLYRHNGNVTTYGLKMHPMICRCPGSLSMGAFPLATWTGYSRLWRVSLFPATDGPPSSERYHTWMGNSKHLFAYARPTPVGSGR